MENRSDPIFALVQGEWQPLEYADDEVLYPCKMGLRENLLASAWLRVHTDHSAVGEERRIQVIQPQYVDLEHDPVVIHTENGQMVLQDLSLKNHFIVDVLLPHALLPRWVALEVIRRGTDQYEEFEQWYEDLYDKCDVKPVLVWASLVLTAKNSLRPEHLSDQARIWNDHQVLAYQAAQNGDRAKALEHLAAGTVIEQELEAAGTNIRSLVCP